MSTPRSTKMGTWAFEALFLVRGFLVVRPSFRCDTISSSVKT